MVNVSDDRYIPYLHFRKLRREGTTLQRGGKESNCYQIVVSALLDFLSRIRFTTEFLALSHYNLGLAIIQLTSVLNLSRLSFSFI